MSRYNYHKMTTISGHKAGYVAPVAPAMSKERWAEIERNQSFVFIRTYSGHRDPIKAAALARSAGVVGDIKVEWTTADMNGKGYGGIDRRVIVADDNTVTDIVVPAEENRDWSAQQSADVWA